MSHVCEWQDFDVFLHAILMTHPGLDFLLDTQAVAVVSCRADFVDTGGVLSSAYLYLTESTSSIRQLDSWITAEVFASSEPRLASQLFWKTLVTAGEVPSPRSSKIDMPIRP